MGRLGRGREQDGGDGGAVGHAVTDEVAHARARFGVDPSTPTRLADAWTAPSGVIEEDESEFLDAVADCLSVGLPLDAAVETWRTGSLQVAPVDHDEANSDDDDTSVFEEDETRVYVPASSRGAPPR
jgi:hypothetical protein